MTSMEFASPPTLWRPGGYSHVVSLPATGRLVWTAGQVPVDADGTMAPAGDWEAQARLTFQNVGHALTAGGAAWGDVVKLTIFVVDIAGLPTIRTLTAYREDISLRDAALKLGFVSGAQFDEWVRPEDMTQPSGERK